jgi:uncharacterized protein YbjT (DUF2867 family)
MPDENSEVIKPQDALPPAPPEPRKIAIVGEIPFSGKAFVGALLRKGLSARVLCPDSLAEAAIREAESAAAAQGAVVGTLETVRGEMDSADALKSTLQGCYGVCFLSPITMDGRLYRARQHVQDVQRVVEASQNAALRKLVYHSGLGAHPESQSRALQQSAEAEEIIHASKCEDFRVRTGPIMGRGDRFMTEIVKTAAAGPFVKVLGYGSTTVQPIHVDDLARCLTRFFVDQPEAMSPGYYSLAGPEALTLMDLLDIASERIGRMKFKFHVPLFVLNMLTSINKSDGFKERISLLYDTFFTEQNDALKLLSPGERLITPKQTQEEILAAAV